MDRITTNEVLEALQAALVPRASGDAPTGPELIAGLNVCYNVGCRIIKEKLEDGTLERVRVKRIRIDGRPMTLTGYRLRT
jgi:hypothetical protein